MDFVQIMNFALLGITASRFRNFVDYQIEFPVFFISFSSSNGIQPSRPGG